jgi:hypothetical protein
VHFARIDYQDRAVRKEDTGLEVIWQGSRTFGSSSQVINLSSIILMQTIICILFISIYD